MQRKNAKSIRFAPRRPTTREDSFGIMINNAIGVGPRVVLDLVEAGPVTRRVFLPWPECPNVHLSQSRTRTGQLASENSVGLELTFSSRRFQHDIATVTRRDWRLRERAGSANTRMQTDDDELLCATAQETFPQPL